MKPLPEDPLRIVSGDFIAAAATPASIPPPQEIEIAFVGRSNVGKSSLLNTLCGRRNAFRTSSTPGCTRQLVFFSIRTKDDARLTLVDVPGYGYAQRSKAERKLWAELIESYLLERTTLAGVALLIDARRTPSQDELDIMQLLKSPEATRRAPVAITAIATKLDKLPSVKHASTLAAMKRALDTPTVGFSTRVVETHAAVWRRLRSDVGLKNTP